MPGGNKTLSATFKAVDNFTPVVNNIAKAGKSATKEIKQFQETLNKGVSASAMEIQQVLLKTLLKMQKAKVLDISELLKML